MLFQSDKPQLKRLLIFQNIRLFTSVRFAAAAGREQKARRSPAHRQILTACAVKPTVCGKFIEIADCIIYNSTVKTKEVIAIQVRIEIDSSYTSPEIVILTASVTDEVNSLVKKLSDGVPQIISGCRNEKIEILEQSDLIRVYANSGKVFAVTGKGEYILRLRLYEIENRLPSEQFIRISNSEIINLKKVNNFDLSLTGTVCVKLSDGGTAYVSRRYIPKLKKILGL